MILSKLKLLHIVIIGSVVCIGVGVGVYMMLIKPQKELLAKETARYNAAIGEGTMQVLQAAQDDYVKAQNERSRAVAALDDQMRRRMPDMSFERRDIGMMELWREQINTLGPLLEGFARDTNVDVLPTSMQIPAPPASPNDAIFDKTLLEFPSVGQIVVHGDFKSLMANVRRWNNCRRLVMVGPIRLAGTSPDLEATYSISCYIFPVAVGGPMIPMAVGGVAEPAAGGPMGMPGGPMGMPPGAMPPGAMPPGGMPPGGPPAGGAPQ